MEIAQIQIRSYIIQGAPEGILSRCTHVRVGNTKVPMTKEMEHKIMQMVLSYGTGRDTLRCIGLGTIDEPLHPSKYVFKASE
jgi:Ca2+ transporting ATPase